MSFYNDPPIDVNTLVTRNNVVSGELPTSPRVRKNRSAPLVLTTSWQRLDLNGTSPLNANTFPLDTDGKPMVDYDMTNKKFLFKTPVDRNYTIVVYATTTATSLLNTVNLTMASIQLRFVVPGGNADGSDYYFPDPEGRGLVDLSVVNSVSPWTQQYIDSFYIDQRKRTGGVGIDVRLSNAVLGTITLTNAQVLFTGR